MVLIARIDYAQHSNKPAPLCFVGFSWSCFQYFATIQRYISLVMIFCLFDNVYKHVKAID
jgi:hypothetical protein